MKVIMLLMFDFVKYITLSLFQNVKIFRNISPAVNLAGKPQDA